MVCLYSLDTRRVRGCVQVYYMCHPGLNSVWSFTPYVMRDSPHGCLFCNNQSSNSITQHSLCDHNRYKIKASAAWFGISV